MDLYYCYIRTAKYFRRTILFGAMVIVADFGVGGIAVYGTVFGTGLVVEGVYQVSCCVFGCP
jgi:hypothetical protein